MTTKEVASICGVTDRTVSGNGLKQDPIYGKLGKIQLNNGRWVDQFYYNDAALNVIEAVIG